MTTATAPQPAIRQPTTTFLDATEIRELTNKFRRSAQIAALRAMCVEHKLRPDGSVAVLRDHITKVFDGSTTSLSKKSSHSTGPNWAAI